MRKPDTRDYGRMPWPAVLVISGGLLAALVLLLAVKLTPQINVDSSPFRYVPSTRPTGQPKVHTSPDKTRLIIQQNPMCWVGVPGVTCQPDVKTYA
jgi:hypothetical protein